MKYINKIMCLAIVLATFVSCDDYLDVNKDPNNPVLADITPDLMLAGAQTTTGGVLSTRLNRVGSTLAGAWGGNVLQFADPFGNEFRFNVTSTFYNDIWDDLYRRTSNYTNIINYTGGNYTDHQAIAKILRAFYFQYLVDVYGDIPYFGKHQYTELLQVPYDDDALIYADLLNELNNAITMIDNSAGAFTVGNEDAIYQGNMTMWRKFANTLKLRLIVRQSNVISLADAQAALAGLSTTDFIGFGDNAAMNPGYAKETDRQNPFFEIFGYSAAGATNNTFVTGTEFALQMVDGTVSGTGTVDGRRSSMYRTNNGGNYVGIEQGQVLGNLTPAEAGDGFSFLGAGYGVDANTTANATKDTHIFTEAESFFLQAEAVTRGYMPGTGLTLFNNGIQASFNLLGATGSAAYQADIVAANGFGYAGSTDQLIEAIISQKWIALQSINGAESWIEMTRTGYPDAPLPLNQPSTVRAVKLLYPISEIQGNSANVPVNQTTADTFVNTVFWN